MKITVLFTTLFLGVFVNASAQTINEFYKFKNDISNDIKNDSNSWKYQTGAITYSFCDYYKNALEAWDLNGVGKTIVTKEDSLYFKNFKPVNAQKYIIDRSRNEQIIIINEAHHNPMHRVFTTSLLQGLYDNGYRYLGLEALLDSSINERKFPIVESGYYTREPQFGNLIHEAIKIGFTVFGYEANVFNFSNGKRREIEQAENIAKIIAKDPKSKFLIHCGYEHIIEGTPDIRNWEKAMARNLKEMTEINPFTIDQTRYTEKGNMIFNHQFISMVHTKFSVIMVDGKGETFNGAISNKNFDCSIIHPVTKYINNRPNWLTVNRNRYIIPDSRIGDYPALILAYRKNEFEQNGVPADIVEISDINKKGILFLDKGDYDVIIKDKFYKIINKYQIQIK